MDQETARKLFKQGAFFIFLDVPEGTEFGIDMKTWNTGERFRGVKMIPSGFHYIFYSSVSTTDDVAPRKGFFHNFKSSEVIVKKWDKQMEDISSEPVSSAEIVGLKENILALDAFLGPYPFDIWDKWKNLTKHISDNTLKNLTPLSGTISSALELQSCSDADRPRGVKKGATELPSCSSKKQRMSDALENKLLPNLKPIEGTELRFTAFPEKNYPDGSTPAEITQHSLDMTYVLERLLEKYSEGAELIGEMQFCYICFLVGHSLEAFEQWKKIVTLFCSCDVAVRKYKKLYDIFISVLEVHIQEIPEEFLADIVFNNNFVYVNLKKLFRVVHDSDLDGQFKTKVDRFRDFLTKQYMWDFGHLESEEEDDAPVVVEVKN